MCVLVNQSLLEAQALKISRKNKFLWLQKRVRLEPVERILVDASSATWSIWERVIWLIVVAQKDENIWRMIVMTAVNRVAARKNDSEKEGSDGGSELSGKVWDDDEGWWKYNFC